MLITLEEAIQRLHNNEIIGIPTETLYGLTAPLNAPEAIEKLFALKGRPTNQPLILLVSSLQQVAELSTAPLSHFQPLIKKFWPGPLTIVLPANTDRIPTIVRANLPTAAFRQEAHPLTTQLLKAVGPLVAPSANLSGQPPATTATQVETIFGPNFPVLDGGPCRYAKPSTLVIFQDNQWQLLREGAITRAQLFGALPQTPEKG